jgi:polyhydroxyalkanoate synthesis regulator phasin
MIASETSNGSASRLLQACVLLCAAAVLPLGLANAQDYGAVERRLGEAVSKGELSLRQAAVMMDALRKAGAGDDKGDNERRFGEWIGSVGEQLKAAVKAGKLSEEDARKKWQYFKENELAPKLKATAALGKVSEEWARSLWRGLEKAEVGERLKAAVAKGEMTEEQAKAKWKAVGQEGDRAAKAKAEPGREEMAEPRREEMEEVGKKIRAAVEAGKITPEQGRAKMEAYRKGIAAPEAKKPDEEHKSVTREDYSRAEAELKKAVATGRISGEDARAKLEGMRKAMSQQTERRGDSPNWETIKERIEGAVKRGDLTRAEADAKYKEIKERTAKDGRR